MAEFILTRQQIQQKLSEFNGTKDDLRNSLLDWMRANNVSDLETTQILNDLESYPEYRMKGVN